MVCCLKTTNRILKNRGLIKNMLFLDNRLVCANQQYQKKLNWDDAVLYCSLLMIDGYSDWRMPTILELQYLSNLSLNECAGKYYWSSDVRNDDIVCVQFFDEKLSKRHQVNQSKNHQCFVKPVRGSK
jgi:hypothetical protein